MRGVVIPLLAAWLTGASYAQVPVEEANRPNVIFKSDGGDTIEIDMRDHVRRGPHLGTTSLRDCSDGYQTCLYDDHGFAFSFFRRCADEEVDDYSRLRFTPKIVMILHEDIWMVFDASPNFMFHYRLGEGLVGIFVGRTPLYDFRTLIRKRKVFRDFENGEYLLVTKNSPFSCVNLSKRGQVASAGIYSGTGLMPRYIPAASSVGFLLLPGAPPALYAPSRVPPSMEECAKCAFQIFRIGQNQAITSTRRAVPSSLRSRSSTRWCLSLSSNSAAAVNSTISSRSWSYEMRMGIARCSSCVPHGVVGGMQVM